MDTRLDNSLTAAAARYAEPGEVEALEASVLDRLAWRLRRGVKECPSCHREKSVGEFGLDSSRRDGLNVYCRACRRV